MTTNNKTAIAMMIEHDARSISIVSGEGDGPGTIVRTKSRTVIGIKRILTRERCEGDRWAYALITLGGGHQFRFDGASLDQTA